MSESFEPKVITLVTTRKTIILGEDDVIKILEEKFPGFEFEYDVVGTWGAKFTGVVEERVTDAD